jgi:hypothetical protein
LIIYFGEEILYKLNEVLKSDVQANASFYNVLRENIFFAINPQGRKSFLSTIKDLSEVTKFIYVLVSF